MKTATLSDASGRMRVARWATVALFATLLCSAANLFGAATVSWLSGGPYASDGSSTAYGYQDGDITADAKYHTPCGLAVDLTGNYLLVADRDNNTVRLLEFDINYAGTLLTMTNYVPTTNLFSKPVGVALDNNYNIFVLNSAKGTNGYVLEFTGDGELIATNLTKLTNAAGIALDFNDNIYVTASNQVIKATPAGVSNVVATITYSNASLQGIVLKRSGPSAGKLAVCDSGRNGIYLIDPNTGIVATNAGFHGAGDFITAQNTSISNIAEFFQPSGIAESGDGTLIVTDFGNHRVKAVLANGSVTNLYGVNSNDWVYFDTPPWQFPGFVDGTVSAPDLPGGVAARQPNGVAMGPDGTIYVTEDYYHIIRTIVKNTTALKPPPPPPPSAPTDLAAQPGYGQVSLTWTGSAGATNYNIKRSTTSGTETTIATTGGAPSNPTYTDTNLLDGTTYFYVVSALNVGGESQNSSEVSAMPLFSPAPTNLVVTATNYNRISLAWSPSAGATSYNVKRSTSTNAETTIANTTSTTYSDTSVVSGETYYYVVSAINPGGENPTNSAEVEVTVPIPPPSAPVIGWFDYEFNGSTYVTVFHAVSGGAFTTHNDLSLAITNTTGNATYYTDDGSTPSSGNGSTPPTYVDGTTAYVTPLPVTIAPDLTIKAVNVNSGGSSAIATAEFIFQVANPAVVGGNAGQFTVTNFTTGAQMYYTTDGTAPNSTNGVGPISSGTTLSLAFPVGVTNLTFEIRGFKDNYKPSDIVTEIFSKTNYAANTISFGFASGPGSSKFVASAGQTFFVPVGLNLLSSAPPLYGLQFNVTLANLGSSIVDPLTIDFFSLLGKPDPKNPGYYLAIPPYMFISTNQPNNDPNAFQYQGDWYQSLLFADTNNEDLLGVGWLEVYGRTNLYNTLSQNLLTHPLSSGADTSANVSQPIVGAYYFDVPLSATPGDVYQIQLGRPSGTTFSGINFGSPVTIEAPTDTNEVGPGSINALKDVTIGQIKYLVGDVYPANWYNAGDFGSSNLINVDVIRVFDFAAYPIAAPPYKSDLFDALDSCGNFGVLDQNPGDPNYGYLTNAATYLYFTNISYSIINNTIYEDTNSVPVSTNSTPAGPFTSPTFSIDLTTYFVTVNEEYTNTYIITNVDLTITTNVVPMDNFVNVSIPPGDSTLFSGNDSSINQIAFGDGVLDVCDVYVTFRRSLDTNNLVWFQRFWTNSVRVATASYAPGIIPAAQQLSGGKTQSASGSSSSATAVNFIAGDSQATAGNTVQIPITAAVLGNYPLRVAMLNLTVTPLDGSPALTSPVSFTPGPALGAPTSGFTDSTGNNNYAAAWLNSGIAGISSNGIVGYLNVPIPAGASSLSAYAIHFDSASGSPNGLGSFPKQTWTGLITLSSRTNSSYNDGIPDSWRLRWFGTVNNLLSVSNACPSGDGVNNWQKYVAGVDPNTPNDFPSLNTKTPVPSGANAAIHWPSVYGKQYAVLSSSSLFPGKWTTNAIVTGTGGDMEYDDSSAGSVKFYRVLILP